jgi:hypothetical protein
MITHEEIAQLYQKHNQVLVQQANELEKSLDDSIRKALTEGKTSFTWSISTSFDPKAVASVLTKYFKARILEMTSNRHETIANKGTTEYHLKILTQNEQQTGLDDIFKIVDLTELLNSSAKHIKANWPTRGRVSF